MPYVTCHNTWEHDPRREDYELPTTLIDLTEQLVEAEAAGNEDQAEWVALAIQEHLGHDEWECLYGKDWAVTGLLVKGWAITRQPS